MFEAGSKLSTEADRVLTGLMRKRTFYYPNFVPPELGFFMNARGFAHSPAEVGGAVAAAAALTFKTTAQRQQTFPRHRTECTPQRQYQWLPSKYTSIKSSVNTQV